MNNMKKKISLAVFLYTVTFIASVSLFIQGEGGLLFGIIGGCSLIGLISEIIIINSKK